MTENITAERDMMHHLATLAFDDEIDENGRQALLSILTNHKSLVEEFVSLAYVHCGLSAVLCSESLDFQATVEQTE